METNIHIMMLITIAAIILVREKSPQNTILGFFHALNAGTDLFIIRNICQQYP